MGWKMCLKLRIKLRRESVDRDGNLHNEMALLYPALSLSLIGQCNEAQQDGQSHRDPAALHRRRAALGLRRPPREVALHNTAADMQADTCPTAGAGNRTRVILFGNIVESHPMG